DAVGEHEVDDTKLAAEGRRRLRTMGGEILQTLAAAARHDDRERAARQAADIASGGGSRGLSGHGDAKGFGIGDAGTTPQEARSRKDLVLKSRSSVVALESAGRKNRTFCDRYRRHVGKSVVTDFFSELQPLHQAELVRMREQLVPRIDAHFGGELPALL